MTRINNDYIRGWAEILFRLSPIDRLPSFDCIDPDDYMAVGSLHPLAEYENPFQIYETLADGQGFALPRPLARYDIVNIAIAPRSHEVASLLLVKLEGDMHLIPSGSRIHYTEERPLALFPIPVAMAFNRYN